MTLLKCARKLALAATIACLSSVVWAQAALAHAQLLGSAPQPGSTVARQPAEVVFEFNEPVGGTLGAVRVYNARGAEVDDLEVTHPDGREQWIGVGLKPGLPDGTYTATYRVVSADTHIVYGGLVFNVGHVGAAPTLTPTGLIDRNEVGEVTKIAFGAVRFTDYTSLALGLGGLAFLILAWLPALTPLAAEASEGMDETRWGDARSAFGGRLVKLLAVAVALGVGASVLGILLQGATAAGVSLWSSLRTPILSDTLKSHFGTVWGAQAIVWALLGVLLLVRKRPRARPPLAVAAGLGVAYLALAPALGGHASVEGPTWIFFPSDVVHVLAASVWVGGIACLLLVLPGATRLLQGRERGQLLLATLARFSPLALACVAAVATTGVVQAYIDVRSLKGLLSTTYGALVIAKTALLVVLIGLGWVNRERVIPALERIVGAGGTPGGAGMLARRTIRGELALMLAVFVLTAALVSYTPPIDMTRGPFSGSTTLGPAQVEMTVEPARAGPNTIHLYLIDAKRGTQFTDTKEFTVTAKLPSKGIGPLHLHANAAGPGHYVLDSAVLTPGGTWALTITDRVSEFQEYSKTVEVPIR